jgi:hypothetical protein
MKFQPWNRKKKKKVLKPIFNFCRRLFAPQARSRIELTFNFDLGFRGELLNNFKNG